MTNTFTFTLRRDKNRLKTWSTLGGAAGDMEVRGQQRYFFLPCHSCRGSGSGENAVMFAFAVC